MDSKERSELLYKYSTAHKILRATEELVMTVNLPEDELKRLMNQRAYYLKQLNSAYHKLMEDKQGGNKHE